MPIHHCIARCLLALITTLVLTWSGSVWAQSKEVMVAIKQYKEFAAQGKYAEATSLTTVSP